MVKDSRHGREASLILAKVGTPKIYAPELV